MFRQLTTFMQKPALYEKSAAKFWDDEHISKGMLESHLDPNNDGATQKHTFVRESVQWIAKIAPVTKYPALLDLGCGPGVYAEFFNEAGYRVTGLDISERSINYARNSAQMKNMHITYHLQDYLGMDFKEQFDLVTIISFDFGVLSTEDRAKLLRKIHKALKPNGLLIFDVFTKLQYSGKTECKSWEYAEEGFFSPEPHICLYSLYTYEEQTTFCNQYIVITDKDVKCINIWEHTFTKNELLKDLSDAGFIVNGLYGNIAGNDYCEDGKEICVVAGKAVN
jgi:SAM-dependent methyltransferase